MNSSKHLTIASLKFLLLTLIATIGFTFSAFAGWDEGVAAFTGKNYQAAAKEFKAFVNANPNSTKGHYMLGLSYFRLNNQKLAQQHLRKAYDLNPNDLSVKVALGRAYVKSGNYKAAYIVLGESDMRTLSPNARGISAELGAGLIHNEGVAAQYLYGTTALKLGKKKEALAALKKAAEAEPGNKTYQRAYKAARE